MAKSFSTLSLLAEILELGKALNILVASKDI